MDMVHRRKAAPPDAPSSQPADTPPKGGRSGGGGKGYVWCLLLLAVVVVAGGAYYKMFHSKEWVVRHYDTSQTHTAQSLEAARATRAHDPTAPLFLSVLGHVFDVSNGESFYGEGARYHVFAFRDASRALATSDYKSQEALTDDLSGLTKSECASALGWLQFFLKKRRKYFYAGRMVGRFFDAQGQPTAALREFEACVEVSDVVELVRQVEEASPAPVVEEGRMFTMQELKEAGQARERDGKGPILLSILGNVFDVTEGAGFYAKGEGYGFFSFTDASRAFVTGEFNEKGLTDDVSGLSNDQCEGVYRWFTFYEEKDEYPQVGKLIGRFYDDKGQPTQALRDFRVCASLDDQGKPIPKPESDEPELVACNTRWAKGQGTTIWCDQEDQVPRKIAGERRCYCIDVKVAVSQPDKYIAYEECNHFATVCKRPDD